MITEQTEEQQFQEALQDYLANGGVVEIIPPRCKTTSKLPNTPNLPTIGY
jgi:hypothetical protein